MGLCRPPQETARPAAWPSVTGVGAAAAASGQSPALAHGRDSPPWERSQRPPLLRSSQGLLLRFFSLASNQAGGACPPWPSWPAADVFAWCPAPRRLAWLLLLLPPLPEPLLRAPGASHTCLPPAVHPPPQISPPAGVYRCRFGSSPPRHATGPSAPPRRMNGTGERVGSGWLWS
jgi:hypothetical protein